jgi:hypothetical protein
MNIILFPLGESNTVRQPETCPVAMFPPWPRKAAIKNTVLILLLEIKEFRKLLWLIPLSPV